LLNQHRGKIRPQKNLHSSLRLISRLFSRPDLIANRRLIIVVNSYTKHSRFNNAPIVTYIVHQGLLVGFFHHHQRLIFYHNHSRFPVDKDDVGFPDFTVDVKLDRHVPDILPIRGKRVRLSYPGIPAFCSKCWQIGHTFRDCTKIKTNWLEYVADFYAKEEVSDDMLGSWIESLEKYHPLCGGKKKQKTNLQNTQKRRESTQEEDPNQDLRSFLDRRYQDRRSSTPNKVETVKQSRRQWIEVNSNRERRARSPGSPRRRRSPSPTRYRRSPILSPTRVNRNRNRSPARREYNPRFRSPIRRDREPERRERDRRDYRRSSPRKQDRGEFENRQGHNENRRKRIFD
jgi:hypothetical protein